MALEKNTTTEKREFISKQVAGKGLPNLNTDVVANKEVSEVEEGGFKDNPQVAANRFARAQDDARKKKQNKIEQKINVIAQEGNPYKKVQRIIDFIKLFFGGLSIVDIFVSAPIFLVVAHGEWLFSALFPVYQISRWKKVLVVIADIIIFIIVLILFSTMYYIVEDSIILKTAISIYNIF